MVIIGSGVAALLLLAAWSNFEPWAIGPVVIPPRPLLYVTFLLLFLVMMYRAVSTAWTPYPPITRKRVPGTLWPYAALVMAGAMLSFAGLLTSANARTPWGDSLAPISGLEIFKVFQPSWLSSLEEGTKALGEGGGRYRPLMFLLLWVVNRLHATGVALVGAHVGVGALIVALLEGWGVRRWVAAMAALSFVLHPVTVKYLGSINIQYMWGAFAFFGALYALQRWMDRPSAARLALALALYVSSTLFSESWLGGAAILISLLIVHRVVSRIETSEGSVPPTALAIALILVVTALLTLLHGNSSGDCTNRVDGRTV